MSCASSTSPRSGPCCRGPARPASSCSSSPASTPPPSAPRPGARALRPRRRPAMPGLALAGTLDRHRLAGDARERRPERPRRRGRADRRARRGARPSRPRAGERMSAGGGAGAPGAGVSAGAGVREAVLAAPLRLEAHARLQRRPRAGRAPHGHGAGPRPGGRPRAVPQAAGSLLVLGFCGGLDASSVPGEVIVAEEVYAAADEGHAEERGELRAARRARDAPHRPGPEGPQRAGSCASRGWRWASAAPSCTRAARSRWTWSRCGWPAPPGSAPSGSSRVVLDSPSHELLRPGAVFGALRAARALRTRLGRP